MWSIIRRLLETIQACLDNIASVVARGSKPPRLSVSPVAIRCSIPNLLGKMTCAEFANADTARYTCAQFIGIIDRSRRKSATMLQAMRASFAARVTTIHSSGAASASNQAPKPCLGQVWLLAR